MSYEYIDTDVEYIGTIPKTWDLVRNKHLFNKTKVIVGPNWDKYNVLSLTKKGVIIKDIENNQGKMPSDFSIYQLVNPGNLLMCLFDIDVTPRCVGYIENKGIVSAAYTELAPVEEIDMKYYYWWYLMLDIDKQLLHLSKNLRNSLSTEDFMALSVVKPPIKEQQQIANYLDKQTAKIDATIAKNEELIQLLEEKRVALINQVVTKGLNPDVPMKDSGVEWIGNTPEHWDIINLKRFSNKITQGPNPDLSIISDEKKYKILKTKDITDKEIKYNTTDYMAPESYLPYSNFKLMDNDILICIVGHGSIGKINIFKEQEIDFIFTRAIGLLRPNTSLIYPFFVKYFFESKIGKEMIDSIIEGSTGQEVVKTSKLGSLNIPYPPLNEQKTIVDYLNKETSKIYKTKDKIIKHIELLEEYKTSLIHHVVTGKIDVRGEEI